MSDLDVNYFAVKRAASFTSMNDLHLCEICANKEGGEQFRPLLGFQDKLHKLLQEFQPVQH